MEAGVSKVDTTDVELQSPVSTVLRFDLIIMTGPDTDWVY